MCPCENMAKYMEHLLGLASVCPCYINRRYKYFVGTLHCELENGADLYVNERQKIRHYRARSTEERRTRRTRRRRRRKKKKYKTRFFYFALCVSKIAILYTHSIGNQP